ncbi:5515_t:CDS:2 [Funneliformis caledonium]|uniref:5515_t:CDS:1 n=1 Tax=Funneliformis caledonium TaxID=1117310 RepID=A0A9N9FEL7_9GLOM|nr:5515_t:CDS:2 [Funneliformis caledonium]
MLPKNISINFILLLLIQLLIEVNCQRFKPSRRFLHTATFIDNKLYVLGGRNDDGDELVGKQFFYLDVTSSFNAKELLWIDMTGNNIIPSHDSATSVKGGINNNTLILFGGIPYNNKQSMDLVYRYDTQINLWLSPNITEKVIIGTNGLTGIFNNGQIYLFGGKASDEVVNHMPIFDTINLKWRKASLINAPTSRFVYGATLLPDQRIIYLGGYNNGPLPLNEVYLYDTINNAWATMTTSGAIPSDRYGFSVVLGLDGRRIIIYGGYRLGPLDLQDSLYVLDLTNFKWYSISFGRGYYDDNDLLLLDISNNDDYKWIDISPSSSKAQQFKIPIIIGAVVGGLVFSLLGGIFVYKWNKKKNEKVIPTPGDEESNIKDQGHEIVSTTQKMHNHGQEKISQIPENKNENLTNRKTYNHGREAISSTDNQQNIDLENFKNEMLQVVRQEILQNLKQDVKEKSEQVSNQNVLENFKSEMLQAVKEEIQTLRQETAHNREQNSNTNFKS